MTPTTMTKPYNHSINDVCRLAEAKMPQGWSAYRWEAATGGNMVTGSIPDGVYRSGPKKGRPRYKDPGDVVIIVRSEMDDAAAAYEASTGNCWDCKGSGETFWKWSKEHGTTNRPCSRCGGTGKAAREAKL